MYSNNPTSVENSVQPPQYGTESVNTSYQQQQPQHAIYSAYSPATLNSTSESSTSGASPTNTSSATNYFTTGSYYSDPYSSQYANAGYAYASTANGYFSYAYPTQPYHQVTSSPTLGYAQSTCSSYPTMTATNQQQSSSVHPDMSSKLNASKLGDSTPEKPVMNDSGVELISPQISSLHTSSSSANSNISLYSTPTSAATNQPTSYPMPPNPYTQISTNPHYASTLTPIQPKTTQSVDKQQAKNGNDDNDENNESESDDQSDVEDEEESNENKENETSSGDKKGDGLPNKPPKPYLEIIADAILSCSVKMMQLHEIYGFMESKYKYFAMNVNKSWRNSVRHNLSLNECFIKAARGTNGKGNYWRIHPLCEREFIRGNFRRKTFKQLIRAGLEQYQRNSASLHAAMHHHNHHTGYHGFTSLPIDYQSSGFNGTSIASMFPPPLPPASLLAAAGKSEPHSTVSTQRYRPY